MRTGGRGGGEAKAGRAGLKCTIPFELLQRTGRLKIKLTFDKAQTQWEFKYALRLKGPASLPTSKHSFECDTQR